MGRSAYLYIPGDVTLHVIACGLLTLLIIGVTPISPFKGIISRVISPIISSY